MYLVRVHVYLSVCVWHQVSCLYLCSCSLCSEDSRYSNTIVCSSRKLKPDSSIQGFGRTWCCKCQKTANGGFQQKRPLCLLSTSTIKSSIFCFFVRLQTLADVVSEHKVKHIQLLKKFMHNFPRAMCYWYSSSALWVLYGHSYCSHRLFMWHTTSKAKITRRLQKWHVE